MQIWRTDKTLTRLRSNNGNYRVYYYIKGSEGGMFSANKEAADRWSWYLAPRTGGDTGAARTGGDIANAAVYRLLVAYRLLVFGVYSESVIIDSSMTSFTQPRHCQRTCHPFFISFSFQNVAIACDSFIAILSIIRLRNACLESQRMSAEADLGGGLAWPCMQHGHPKWRPGHHFVSWIIKK